MELARSIGFDAIDASPLRNACLLEPIEYQNLQLGYMLGMGTASASGWFISIRNRCHNDDRPSSDADRGSLHRGHHGEHRT
jgi:hypothetical protein